ANRDFYVLLARRRGVADAVAGVGLHAVHHLTALAAIPAGVAVHLRDRRAHDQQDGCRSRTGAAPAPEPTIIAGSPVPDVAITNVGAPAVDHERSAS
ncbi:MAG: hypothetical protein ACXWYP_04960, partial [Pseudonocardia sp.]